MTVLDANSGVVPGGCGGFSSAAVSEI